MTRRRASVERNTKETQIKISIDLDGEGVANLNSGVPFLNHMLDQVARHGLIDIDLQCEGDTHIDDHHSVEDIGIALGMAMDEALGNKVGTFDVDLASEFFQGFANHARATVHADVLRGVNDHHKIETLFKALGRALRAAISIDERMGEALPSTKGAL